MKELSNEFKKGFNCALRVLKTIDDKVIELVKKGDARSTILCAGRFQLATIIMEKQIPPDRFNEFIELALKNYGEMPLFKTPSKNPTNN